MYNDTIKVANKIITSDDLLEIFAAMEEKKIELTKIAENEKIQNQMLDSSYQSYTMKDLTVNYQFDINFYDDTRIKIDNYNTFIGVYNSRIQEIKDMYVRIYCNYFIKNPNVNYEMHHHSINMWIYESKMEINVDLDSSDPKLNNIYDLIKNKVLTAPEKYDDVIKRKNSICLKTELSFGLIVGIIVASILLVIPVIRQLYIKTYILYPVVCFIIGFVVGGIKFSNKFDKLYSTIKPEQKYAGYDSSKGKSIYKDDIDKFTSTSEILIGKNVDNLINRQTILKIEKQYKNYLLPEICIIILVSIILIILGIIL